MLPRQLATLHSGRSCLNRYVRIGRSPLNFRPLFFGMVIVFHKPFGVHSRFTEESPGTRTLAEFGFPPDVYPIGRLDADSEGLLLLSDEPQWNSRLLPPARKHPRRYYVQIERIPSEGALRELARGLVVQGRKALPCRVWRREPPTGLVPRDPPIRFRKNVPDCWIELELIEGKNRQVRRMTAALGHPTLRLIRFQIGAFPLGDLKPGQWRVLSPSEQRLVLDSGR